MKGKFWMVIPLLLLLNACTPEQQQPQSKPHEQFPYTLQMHHIHMLINHALQMAAQGTDMKIQGEEHGNYMLKQATELLQRAMSGPEMARLHAQGYAKKHSMIITHQLADQATQLFAQMRNMNTTTSDKRSVQMLNHALELAATGSNLVMLGQQGMAGDIDTVMVNHGQSMLGDASRLLQKESKVTAYREVLEELVEMLIGIPDMPIKSKN